ncbi:hypothetical protein V6N12_026493 [Hibiscus sabdariffa]|uniref:F-box domain-containing protein n=1 Tax=Hibiscus sabdariffa TaxID=183260 RepID=A0ABR2DRX3_9ROSI
MSKNPIGSNNCKLNDGGLTQKEQGNDQRKGGGVVEVNGEDEEEEECFYESLERIASSNSCSCSNSTSPSSDSDSDPIARSSNANHPFPVPKFPKVVSQFHIWISEPASVSERRTRLLREMGLSRHPGLSRIRPDSETDFGVGREVGGGGGTAGAEFGRRSVSSNPLVNKELEEQDRGGEKETGSSAIVRSNSDDDCNDVSVSYPPSSLRFNSSSLILSVGLGTVNNNNICECNQNNAAAANLRRCGNNGSKPPTGRISKSLNGELGFKSFGDGEAVVVDDEIDCSEQVCTIKNLDNGEQFVVNEIREDGMWNKVKEVGTGRQLTMEEFQVCVGHSPIVQELMRRQNVEEGNKDNTNLIVNGGSVGVSKLKKKGGWFKSIKSVANSMKGNKERRSSDEKDTSSERGGRRSSSATDDSQDVSFHGPERVRVKQYGKPCKELTALYKSQEIQAHTGSIWSIKFSLDGKYLASAGEDCIIHVWKVIESERKGELLMEKSEDGNLSFLLVANGSPEPTMSSPSSDPHSEKKRRGRSSVSRKSLSLDHIVVPETVFALTDKPICSFQGHLDDVLDLSWSKSQQLLSSSMDKTVRLWDLTCKTCLRIFSHSDYVTCIQFNPVDDRYFISGSLDAKVRIWNIPDCKVVDWNDLHEMVTAACYTPDGQGALVGSYKGSCQLYNASENKLLQKSQINLQNKKKKSHLRKITGFQFAPGSSSEVLVTSADSRIRVVDGSDLIHKFKGFRNTNSQISASVTANGKYVVCASEDSYVYVWKHEVESRPSRNKGVTETRSYEHFHCKDVSVAIPWSGIGDTWGLRDTQLIDRNCFEDNVDEVSTANHPPTPVVEYSGNDCSLSASGCTNSPLHGTISSATNSYFFDRISATWPEEKLLTSTRTWSSPKTSVDISGVNQNMSAWGMVIVTAGLRDRISSLPDSILFHIISFLPTKDTVRASILSSRWGYLVASSVPILDFNSCLSRTSAPTENDNNFLNFVDRFFSNPEQVSLECLRLNDRWVRKDGIPQAESYVRLKRSICAASSRCGVKEIDINLMFKDGSTLPGLLFTCRTLKLNINGDLKVPANVCLPNLKILHFAYLKFQDGCSVLRLISSCPVLEDLESIRCEFHNTSELNIHSLSLKRLVLDFGEHRDFNVIEINAPNLVYFKYVRRSLYLAIADGSEPASTYRGFKSLPETVSSCLLFHIEEIEFERFDGEERMFEMVSYFLEHASVLEKLVIRNISVYEKERRNKKLPLSPLHNTATRDRCQRSPWPSN